MSAKINVNIDDLILNERIAGITTGHRKEEVMHVLGHPLDTSDIYQKIGVWILLYGNLHVTIYKNFVSGVAVDLTLWDEEGWIAIDQDFLEILSSGKNFYDYLMGNRIDFCVEGETVSIRNSHAFFSLRDGRGCIGLASRMLWCIELGGENEKTSLNASCRAWSKPGKPQGKQASSAFVLHQKLINMRHFGISIFI